MPYPRTSTLIQVQAGYFFYHYNFHYHYHLLRSNINNTLICDGINGLIGWPGLGINVLFTKLTYLAPHIWATQNKCQHTLFSIKLILKEESKPETELSYIMV